MSSKQWIAVGVIIGVGLAVYFWKITLTLAAMGLISWLVWRRLKSNYDQKRRQNVYEQKWETVTRNNVAITKSTVGKADTALYRYAVKVYSEQEAVNDQIHVLPPQYADVPRQGLLAVSFTSPERPILSPAMLTADDQLANIGIEPVSVDSICKSWRNPSPVGNYDKWYSTAYFMLAAFDGSIVGHEAWIKWLTDPVNPLCALPIAKAFTQQQTDDNLAIAFDSADVNGNINPKVKNVIALVHKERDEWQFDLWQVGKTMTGNDSYAEFRCHFNGSGNINKAKSLKAEIEAKSGYGVQIIELPDTKSSFTMRIIFKPDPSAMITSEESLLGENKDNKLILGNSTLGRTFGVWKSGAANHMLVAGSTNSGKTELVKTLVSQLTNLGTNPVRRLFITSGLKVADYMDLAKTGAYLGSGAEAVYNVLNFLFEETKSDEQILMAAGIRNVTDYNKTVADDKRIPSTLAIFDEYQTALDDKSWGTKVDDRMEQLISVARAYNITVIIANQNPLTSSIGKAERLIGTRWIGFNQKIQLQSRSKQIADFFDRFTGNTQGLFFYSGQFMKAQPKYTYDGTAYTLLRTPYIKPANYLAGLPKLSGAEFKNVIENGKPAQRASVKLNKSDDPAKSDAGDVTLTADGAVDFKF